MLNRFQICFWALALKLFAPINSKASLKGVFGPRERAL